MNSQVCPVPQNEDLRLQVLSSHDILDTEPEDAFNSITGLAAQLSGVPISLVSLVDRERQFFKSCFGLNVSETPREQSFCAHAIMTPDEPLIIEDATADRRTSDNPLVLGYPNIRFYAGFPIKDRESAMPLGTLCVIDTKKRSLSRQQIKSLRALAELVEDELELRLQKRKLEESGRRLRKMYKTTVETIESLRENILHTVSHELRTPLNAVVGISDFLESEWKDLDPKEVQEMIGQVNEGGLSLARVVERITLFAELQLLDSYGPGNSDSGFLEEGECSVADAVISAMHSAKELLPALWRENDLQIDVGEEWVKVPGRRLAFMIGELVTNSLKFSVEGTPIRIAALRDAEGNCRITVSDEGHGFREGHIDKIGALMQFDRDLREQQGWGLGLAMISHAAEYYGGSISFESEVGRFSRVSLVFPGV